MLPGLTAGIAALLWADTGVKMAAPGGISAIVLSDETLENPRSNSPAVTFQIVGGSGNLLLGPNPVGKQRRRFQFDAHAFGPLATGQQAYAARDAIGAVLNGFSGELPNGFVIDVIELRGEIDFFDSDSRSFRAMAEYYVSFSFQSL